MDDEIIEEVNEQLLITVINTEQIQELRSISISDDDESESANNINISQCSLLFKISFAITIMLISVAFVSFIIWITPTPPTVHVHSMELSFADNKLPIWSATFSIKNYNKKLHVTYKNPKVRLLHHGKLVSMVRAESFGQRGGEEKEVVVMGDETRVINEKAAWDMEEEFALTGGIVGLDMVFVATIGFYPGTSTLWGEQNMTAICENVRAKLCNVDDKIYGTNRLVLSFDRRLDCRVRLPLYP